MVNYSPDRLDRVFGALGDRTRRAMLQRLSRRPHSVTELARPFAMSLPAASKHIRVLERAGLIRRRRDGRVHRCSLDPRRLKEATDWLAQYRKFWESSMDSLAAYLETLEEQPDA